MSGEPVRTCLRCGEVELETSRFVTRASCGELELICSRCFHLQELDSILLQLPRTDSVRSTIEEGLETLYVTAKNQLETLVAKRTRVDHGSEESQSKSRRRSW